MPFFLHGYSWLSVSSIAPKTTTLEIIDLCMWTSVDQGILKIYIKSYHRSVIKFNYRNIIIRVFCNSTNNENYIALYRRAHVREGWEAPPLMLEYMVDDFYDKSRKNHWSGSTLGTSARHAGYTTYK